MTLPRRRTGRLLALVSAAVLSVLTACSTPAAVSPSARPTAPSSSQTPSVPVHPEDAEPGRPGTEDFGVSTTGAPGEIEGFANPSSATPGTAVALHVSTTAPTVTVTAFRMGGYTGGRARQIWSGIAAGTKQGSATLVAETRTVVAEWDATTSMDTTGWPAGFYLFRLQVPSGAGWLVPFILRSPSTKDRVALVAPTLTWQAYNDWGGRSLYKGPNGFGSRSYAVSFDRPYPASGAGEFLWAVLPFVVTAEQAGVPLAYLADTDMEADPAALEGARGAVSVGHDEYWTTTRRERWDAARDAGTNLLITSANALYWRVRLGDGVGGSGPHRLVTGYKQSPDPQANTDPRNATTLFKLDPGADPPEKSIGLRYECYPASVAFTVADPGWWGFAGASVSAGTSFPHLMGIETDRYYPLATTPRPMRVLANQDYSCKGMPTSAQAVEYAVPSGAVVVNLNSMRWSCALALGCRDFDFTADEAVNSFAATVTKTILTEFAKGPVAKRHPVEDTVATLDVPAKRTVYPDP